MSRVLLDTKGLVLAPGELSKAPGALTVATNVNIEAPGVIRSRQGFARQANGVGGPGWKFISTKELGANLLFNHGSQTAATGLKYGDGSAAWTTISGTVTNQPATRMQAAVSRRNHYLTSDEGVRRIESDMSIAFAGMPRALPVTLYNTGGVVLASGGTVLADGESVAYRVTWHKKDAQGIIMDGAPSSRTVIYNNARTTGYATATSDINCRIPLPMQVNTASTALTTSYFYRLWRSKVAAAGISPSDQMNLVGEAFLTSGNISAGYVVATDAAPEAFRLLGASLYTNENLGGDNGVGGPGIDQANDPPPRARDVVLFSECLFYSDLVYPSAQEFTILSTVAATGVTAADTLTIGGITYTAIAPPVLPAGPANNEFVVATVAAGSTQSEAVERTAMSLVCAINSSTTNTTTWAQYVSTPTELPGTIRITSRTATATFTAVASAHGSAYRPSLAAAVTSVSDTYANGFAFSKPAAGDAVPPVNLGFLGRDDTALLRQVVLRDAIYQFTDSGIYRLTGRSFEDFQSQEFDLSFRLRGRDLVCVCDDYIYAWGYEGIARISSSGVEYISNAIEPLLWQIVSATVTGSTNGLGVNGWAAAYRSRHKVLFAYPSNTTTGNCSRVLVYDTRMQAWSTWEFARGSDSVEGHSAGAVRVTDDLLFMGQWNSGGTDASVYKERLAYAAADYKDDTSDTTDQAIVKTVTWSAVATSPELETHWDEVHLLYDVSPTFSAWTTPTALTVAFTSDLASASGSIPIAPTATSRMSRCLVSRAQRRSARLVVSVAHSTAGEYFGLEGMALVYLPGEGTATVRT